MSRAHKAALRALIGLGLLAALLVLAKPQALWATLRGADWRWLALGLGSAIASNVLSAWRWRLLVLFLGGKVRFRDALRWYFQAIGLNSLLPGAVVGGDVYRALMLRRAGQAPAAAGWSVVLDRVSGLWMLCAIGGLGAAACAEVLAPWLRLPVTIFAPLLLAGTALWLALPWALPALLGQRPRAGGWLAPLRLAAARPDFRRQLGWQAAASVAVQLLSATALAAGALALGVQQPLAVWAWAIAPVFLMAALPLSVGGWGTREAAAVAALAPFGVAAPAAVGVAVVYGLYGLAQGALGALAFGLPRNTTK